MRSFTVGVLLGAMLLLPLTPALANDVDCSAQFDAVSGTIDAAVYTNDLDRTRLQGKLTEAEAKFALHKYLDAESKLLDIRDKVVALNSAAKPKIKDDPDTPATNEVEAILDAVTSALACIPGGQ